MRSLRASIFVAVVSAFSLSAQQVPGQEKQPPSPSGQMKSMEKMSMDDVMKDCMKHHQAGMKSIDQMSKMMEGAKQSNDPGKMRSSIRSSSETTGGNERAYVDVQQYDEHDGKDEWDGRKDEGQIKVNV